MKIKDIKEKYKNYGGEHCSSVVVGGEYVNKVVIIVEVHPMPLGDWVVQVVRVSDGKELLDEGACRPCDNLDDAVDVAFEMHWNW